MEYNIPKTGPNVIDGTMENLKKIVKEDGRAYIRTYNEDDGSFEILDKNSIMVVDKVGKDNLQGFLIKDTVESTDQRPYNGPAYMIPKKLSGVYKPDLMEMKEFQDLVMSMLNIGFKIEMVKDRTQNNNWMLILRK